MTKYLSIFFLVFSIAKVKSQSYFVDTSFTKKKIANEIVIKKKTKDRYSEINISRRMLEIYVDNSIYIDEEKHTAYILSAIIESPGVSGKMPLRYSLIKLNLKDEMEIFTQTFSVVVSKDRHYKFYMAKGELMFFYNDKNVRTLKLDTLQASDKWWDISKSSDLEETTSTTSTNSALAIWRGDEYILSFLLATQLQFWMTDIAKQQNKK